MVQVDLPGAFAVGQILAYASREYLRAEENRFAHRLTGPLGWYLSLMYAPVGMFLLVGWPAWEVMFWWKWVEDPSFRPLVALFYVGFFIAMIVIGHASYALAHTLLRRRLDSTVRVLIAVGVVLTVLPFILWPSTWLHVGTYDQYHSVPRATAAMLSTPSFLYPWMAVMGYLALSTLGFYVILRRFSLKSYRVLEGAAAAAPVGPILPRETFAE